MSLLWWPRLGLFTDTFLSSQVPSSDLHVPRLSKPNLAACPPLAKHANSSTSILTTAPSDSSGSPDGLVGQASLGTSGRPKTSHTTIERRYRTNLNARILALRHAVPALRILEKDQNLNARFPQDALDERGFVDGVKAARKASKASILGKAAEYIQCVLIRNTEFSRTLIISKVS